jgi:hypothetical protein
MARFMKITIAVCLILAIAYIVVLPAFNIGPTALRAARNAVLLFTSMAAAAYVITILRPQAWPLRALPTVLIGSAPELIDLTCTRLC